MWTPLDLIEFGAKHSVEEILEQSCKEINTLSHSSQLTRGFLCLIKTENGYEFVSMNKVHGLGKGFSCPDDWEHEVKKMWAEKAAKIYSSFISTLKKMYTNGKSRPIYVPQEMWSGLIDLWKVENVIKKSEAAKKARMSEPDGQQILHPNGMSCNKCVLGPAEKGVSMMDCVHDWFQEIHSFKDGRHTYKKAADVDVSNLKSLVRGSSAGTPGINGHASTGLDPSVRAERNCVKNCGKNYDKRCKRW
ncbi:hypothetical protein SASPL_103859 [Salvia splendens]|uniref:Uncharacterized protein n=1 Tax=Salvia splendens TaxID=180675 RepID=A0A8X9AA37_SALSN|nr:hypothetical protein SASPL_103859 [Salvia splendens]